MRMKQIGPFMVMVAAAFWAIDALFRTELTNSMSTTAIVFMEHLIGAIFLTPFMLNGLKEIKALEKRDWYILLVMTLISSILGTLLFTEALTRSQIVFDFVTPTLLQKLQPVIVVILSVLFLKERLSKRFILLAATAMIGSFMISFGTDTSVIEINIQEKFEVVMLTLGAAFSWGAGTVLSKDILNKLSFTTATAARFYLAIPFALVAHLIYTFTQGVALNPLPSEFDQIWRLITIAGITGGAGAMLLYYHGLKYTKATISTFAELMFPFVSILIAATELNPYGSAQDLDNGQTVGIVILLTSVVLISLLNQKNNTQKYK